MLSSVTIRTDRESDEALRAGDLVEIEARGTAGCRALVGPVGLDALADATYPFTEVENGVYRGRSRVNPRAMLKGRVSFEVVLVDRFGNPSLRAAGDRELEIDAPRVPAPEALVVELVDPGARKVKVKWNPVEDASTYVLVRIIEDEILTLDVGELLEVEDELPEDTTSAVYSVAARTTGGTVGEASDPSSVVLEDER